MLTRLTRPHAAFAFLVALALGAPAQSSPSEETSGQDTLNAPAESRVTVPPGHAINDPDNPDDFRLLEPSRGRPERGGTGTLRIASWPAGGDVYFGGQHIGRTPFEARVPSGRDELSIIVENKTLVRQRVNVWDGETTALFYELRMPFGIIVVRTTPPSAEIRLNGVPVGRTEGAELRIRNVRAGGHILTATAGGRAGTQQITVPAEDSVSVNIQLR